ncbi:MAG: HlyD family efflux transporter periplasmic adaptor subunit [Clostridia bacterium]|nr:HlyD family efflux transporter periplasmic adaptor subunit [Clostridia bacterium]
MKNNKGRRILAAIIAVVIVLGGGAGGVLIWRSARRKPVKVFPVADCAMTDDYFGGQSQTYGEIRVEGLQKVMLSETQTVKEIFVEEGDEIRKGDPILSFDTTLSDLDISKAEINVTRLQNQKQSAERELSTLRGMKPYSPPAPTMPTEPPEPVYVPRQTPEFLSGDGTEDSPYLWLWGADDAVDDSVLEKIFPASARQTTEPAVPDENVTQPDGQVFVPETEPADDAFSEAYAVLVVRENDALNAPVVSAYGLHFVRDGDSLRFSFFEPDLPDDSDDSQDDGGAWDNEEEFTPDESGYSAAQLAKMRAEKEKEIKDLTISLRIAELEVKRLKKEAADGTLRAEVDGIVKAVRDPVGAYENGEPVAEISAGGGYYITGAMSEMELGSVHVGQTVQITSYTEMGMSDTYEGEIVEISDIPTRDGEYYGEGNPNVSNYPFKVFVNESADLREGDYADIVYAAETDSEVGTLFLPNMFIRLENGRSFVYVKDAQNRLERRAIRTGGDLWGEYTRVRSGLTTEDSIAFPYGSDVFDGAKTRDASIDELYEGSYGY